jgi:hypothetical protein
MAGQGARKPVCVFEGTTGRHLRCFQPYPGSVLDIAFTSDGTRILTAAADALTRLHHLSGEIERIFGEACLGPYAVIAAAAAPGGQRALAVRFNGRVDVWNKQLGLPLITLHSFEKTQREKTCTFELTGTQFRLASAAISSDLRRVLALTDDGTPIFFEVPGKEELIREAARYAQRRPATGRIERAAAP